MGCIERADGTIYDTTAKEEAKRLEEERIADMKYEAYMEKVRESAAQNRTPYTPTMNPDVIFYI